MSVSIIRIPEFPWNKESWALIAEAAAAAGVTVAELEKVCGAIGAKVIDYGDRPVRPGGNAHDKLKARYVDFGRLSGSAAWKQLLSRKKASDSQGELFGRGGMIF